jgi:hypothetical protein
MAEACGTVGEHINAYTVLVRKHERNRTRGRRNHKWENNIELYPEQRTWTV